MRWVSPLLFVGSEADAEKLDFAFIEDNPSLVARQVKARSGCVVPTRQEAAEALRHLGATEDWIQSHVMSDWEGEPALDT